MKRISTFLLLFCAAMCVFATPRSVDMARMEANGFLMSASASQAKRMPANSALSLAHVVPQKTNSAPAAYVFQSGEDNGFVIVSADDACTDILGYSANGKFDAENIPANLQTWLQHYAEEVEWAAQQPQTPLVRRAKVKMSSAAGRSVSPLLNGIQWDQDAPFNNLCPIDSDNSRSVTGCVATAASQIMAFWQHPTQGMGSHSYTWTRSNGSTRTVSANFGTTTYDWSHMLPSYAGSYTTTQANAVATLMFHAGVACEMEYSSESSGASTSDMAIAMQNYFGYDHAMTCYNADYEGYTVLADKIQEELEAGRPVMMSGATTRNEGHCFVCEGSDGNGKFYFNWGWSGNCDGYYQLSALEPRNQGIGGASSGLAFTVRVSAYTGIQPDQGGLAAPARVGAESVTMSNAAVVTKTTRLSFSLTKVSNIGLTAWSGYLAMAIYDKNGNYIGKFQTSLSYSLNPGYYKTNSITVSGTLPSSLADGRYVLVPAYTIESSDVIPLPIQSDTKQFPFIVKGNMVNFNVPDDVDQEEQYTIVFKDSDTGSDVGTQISSSSALSTFIDHSDITISSYACSCIYLAKDNYGLKFGSSSKDGFLTLNLAQEIIVDSIDIVVGGYNDTERNFILQGTTLTNIRKASSGFETRTVHLGGARLNTISLQSTKRAYVKSLTIYTTDVEKAQASFDFTSGEAHDYTSFGYGTNVTVFLFTDDYVEDNSTYAALTGTSLTLDLGTLNPHSIVGTYVLGENSTYTPGLLNSAYSYSYLTYGDEKYAIESGVVSIINNNKNQFEFLYDLQVADGKSYTGNVVMPISSVSLHTGNNSSHLSWQYEPIVAWDANQANTEIATLPQNTPSIHTYLVEGIISQVNAVGVSNSAQFYISQDGTTNQQLYCYNARYLNNGVFAGGEIALGDTVVMFAKLENYNGTYELMGYVFQHRPYVDKSLFTPYDLAVEVGFGHFDFSWECDEAYQYELEIIDVATERSWTFYSVDKFTSVNYSGEPAEFAWRVRSLDENGDPLSDWVDGENFTSLENPYQPHDLQVLTTDGSHFVFTWTADSIADSYVVEITLNGYLYAQLTVTEPVATTDIAITDTYGWNVYAYDADGGSLGWASGEDFEAYDLTDYSIQNLAAITNGLTISATWDSPAPLFDVRVLDANSDQIYSDILDGNSMQYTVPATGTYYVYVRPVNAEYTYYLADWTSTTVTVSSATPSTQTYTLTLRAMTGGTVNTSAAGTYSYGSVVDIEATADPTYRFLQWSDGNTNARRSVVMTKNITLTAYFYEIVTYTLTINEAVGGHVSLPAGQYIYAEDASEVLYAMPDEDYEFAYWQISGQTENETANPLILEMVEDITVTPVFTFTGVPTDVNDVAETAQPVAIKKLMNNQVVIVYGEHIYNMLGQTIR